jgi:hypothetical protein
LLMVKKVSIAVSLQGSYERLQRHACLQLVSCHVSLRQGQRAASCSDLDCLCFDRSYSIHPDISASPCRNPWSLCLVRKTVDA